MSEQRLLEALADREWLAELLAEAFKTIAQELLAVSPDDALRGSAERVLAAILAREEEG